MISFRNLRKFLGPAWLTQNGDSVLVGYTVDALKDAFVERLRQGLLARFPQQDPTGTPAADDTLAAIGRDRRIVRGINEASSIYAARLLRWLDDWQTAGNPFALMKQLSAYCDGIPDFRTVDARGNWFTYTAAGAMSVSINQANWDWDATDPTALQRWSRFWVVIYPNGLWTNAPKWDDGGAWGDGRTWGSTATPEEVASVRQIIADWKPAGTRCQNVILAFDQSSFSPTQLRDGTGLPDGTWGHWSKIVNGQYVPARLTSARYWDGI